VIDAIILLVFDCSHEKQKQGKATTSDEVTGLSLFLNSDYRFRQPSVVKYS